MSDWVLDSESSSGAPIPAQGSEWELEAQPQEESFGKSLLYAAPRIATDLAKGAYHAVQKIPKLYQSSKTEVPGLLDIVKNHRHHAALQALAGSQEAINNLNHIPANLAQYANERLHLLPKGVGNFLNKITPDTTQAINDLFEQPKYPGEKLIRGTARNLPSLVPAARVAGNVRKLAPSNALRGTLSPEELRNNLRIAQGTETNLGDVIGSPHLKRLYENVISKIPTSGANQAMQRTAGEIVNRGNNLLEHIAGSSNIENLDHYLNDALKSSYKSHQAEKNAHYNNVNNMADELGLRLDLPEFAKKTKQHKNAIEDTNILKYEPEMQGLLRKLGNYENPIKSESNIGKILDLNGNPILNETKLTKPTLKEANLLKGKLNQLASQHSVSFQPSDRHLAGVFGGLASTLKKDIEGAIEKLGNPSLKKAYKAAEENYAKNFSPFMDNEIYKFINGKADPETLISSFIKTGKSNDRAGLINKIISKLPEKDRNLLGYGYLQRALDENNIINPLKLKTLISRNALGPKQFEALFPDLSIRNALKDYSKLTEMNTKGLKLMQNPETGQMTMDILPLLSKSPKNFLMKMTGAPLLAKKLSSEKTRTRLVNKMINKRSKAK